MLEYCRIIWDIFPTDDKLIQFVVSGSESSSVTPLTTWAGPDQSSAALSSRLANIGRPESSYGGRRNREAGSTKGILAGLRKALESLCEITEAQRKVRARTAEGKDGPTLVNRGRIVCITSIVDDRRLHALLMAFNEEFTAINQLASSSDTMIPISQLSLDIVHCHPGDGCIVTPTSSPQQPFGHALEYQVFSVDAGKGLAKKLLSMVLAHYQLASTTGSSY